MAGDWIKMRTDLYRDPKVVMMADHLSRVDGDLGRYVSQNLQCDMAVTRNVTRCATVGALVTLWGVTRHRGKRYADDLVVQNAGLRVVDEIADIPGFGAAMASVGWVRETPEGLVFPHFFEEFNIDPAEDAKAKAAARQRRYREKQQKKSDVTVTSPGDAREEQEHAPAPAPALGPRTRTREDLDQKEAGKKTRKKPKRTAVTVEAIADRALGIFQACHYRGADGGNLWGVAALMETGIGDLSENEVASACQGAALNGRDKAAHFFACLSETLEKRGENLTELLRRVAIVPEWPKTKLYQEATP